MSGEIAIFEILFADIWALKQFGLP